MRIRISVGGDTPGKLQKFVLYFGDSVGCCDGTAGFYTVLYGRFLQTFRRSAFLPPSSG
jgi:hypothetical protein